MNDFWDATYFELCCAYDGLCRWHGTGPFARKKPQFGAPWTREEVRRAQAGIERANRTRDRLPAPRIPDAWLTKLRRVNARLKAKQGRAST